MTSRPLRPSSRSRICLGVLAVALSAPALAGTAAAQDREKERPAGRTVERYGDLVSIFSGEVRVPVGIRQRGSVVCVGGTAVVEGDVTGDVVAVICNLEVRGSVGGAVTGVLSDMKLKDATVARELVSVLGTLDLENTTVKRELVNILGALDRDELSRAVGQVVNIGFGGKWIPSLGALLFWLRLFHKFVVFVLLGLIVLLVPEQVRLMGDEAPVRYVPAFFVGLLAYIVMLTVAGLLLLTVVAVIPAMLAFYVLKWMGIAGIFFAIGRRLARGAGFSPSVLGAVLLVFAIYCVILMAPAALGLPGLVLLFALKFVFLALIEVPAVGLVILTRFGTRRAGAGCPPPVPAPPLPTPGAAPVPRPPAEG